MTNFEIFVRPFQLRSVTPALLVADETAQEAEDIVIEIGDPESKPKTLSTSYNETKTFYMDNKAKVVPLNTTTLRIKNPEDDQQYVDVERIDREGYKRGSGVNYQKDKNTYTAPPDSEANAEVLKKTEYNSGGF